MKALKNATMAQLMETGKLLFFPNGRCKLGNVTEFEFTMQDFTDDELERFTTLGQQYEYRKVLTIWHAKTLLLSHLELSGELLSDLELPVELLSQLKLPVYT